MKGYEWKDLWDAMDAHPENWQPTTEAMYNEMLGVVFPTAMDGSAFLVGEPNHHNNDGIPVYACFRNKGGHYEAMYLTEEGFRNRDLPDAKRVCKWCNKVLREGPEDNITHGICVPCSTKMLWLEGLSETELTGFINMMKEKYGDKI